MMKKKHFANVDPDNAAEEARRFLLRYFRDTFLHDEGTRGDDEEAAREAMFNKLSELESIVRELKKGVGKKK